MVWKRLSDFSIKSLDSVLIYYFNNICIKNHIINDKSIHFINFQKLSEFDFDGYKKILHVSSSLTLILLHENPRLHVAIVTY